ncbi:cadherin-like domain-containing protein [Methylorubrum salsuginis]|uniref:Cadherin-like n=1 Tax=Methylorubrum salsuginis TaxID=414703 RepID=A0A1I4LLM4_9HYPH|nr:cadherin-like domain-containing protein [Methylorubrum salsuginis]SFL91746.1 Cadherin-like [Methylorubrum salsuginis]
MAIEWIGPFYSETYENSGNPGMAISARDSNGWSVHLSVEDGGNGALLENYYNYLRIKPALWEGSEGYEAHLTSDNLFTAKIKATVYDPSTGGVAYTAYQTYSFRVLDSSPPGRDGDIIIDEIIGECSATDTPITDAYGRPYYYGKAYASDGWGNGTLKLVDDAGGRFKLETVGDNQYLRVADGAKLDFQTYAAAGGQAYKLAFEVSDGTTTLTKVGYISLRNATGTLTGDFSAEVAPKGAYTLTAADLGAEKAGANPIFVVSNPTGGNLVLKGATTPVTSFTGADVAAGKVQFVQSGKGLTASFDVAARDGGELTATKTFSLSVANQAPKDMIYVGPLGGGATTLNYQEETEQSWGLRVTDPEGETNTTGLKWSIVGGADRNAFTILEKGIGGGTLDFKTAHDFEAPTDANRDNRYEVVVRVADSYGAYLDKAWTVSVINLKEVVVAEGAAAGTLVQGAQSIPVPGSPISMKYALPAGEGRFTIDRNTGAIKVAAGFKIDFEQASTIRLTVMKDPFAPEAVDASHSTPILIKVRDVRDEIVSGDGRDNTLVGGAGNDTFFGLGGADDLTGGNGRNRLDGGTGNDRLIGGLNEDTYVVDSLKDIVSEQTGGGRDTIEARISYDLDAQAKAKFIFGAVEDLTLLEGRAALKATGNALANTLRGNGNANTLDGKGGIDTMQGLGGNDTYFVDHARDSVIEAAKGGVDTVLTSVGYTLAARQEIEALRTVNAAAKTALNLTGNEFGQTLQGNAGANVLNGMAGKDILTGSSGKDTFVFSTALGAGNVDRITDFSVVDDSIQLSKGIFTALSAGTLAAGAFKDLSMVGAKVDADDRILYNKTTGALSYDVDGSGSKAAVQFATIDTKVALTHADFLVV